MTRRSLLQGITSLIYSVMGLVLAFPALRFLGDPLKRKRRVADFIRVAPLSALNPSVPARIVVRAARTDGFLRFPAAPIGQVWIDRRNADDSTTSEIRCLQSICPHLGCGIDYSPARGGYACPCHASDFARDGARLTGPAPRNMDELDCRVTAPDAGGERWVEIRYQEFRTGVAQCEPLA